MSTPKGTKALKNRVPLATGTPAKPSNLSDRASLEWDRLTRELEKAGIQVTPAHRAALSTAATLQADISEDWNVISDEGPYSRNEKTGQIQAHPAVKRMDALRRDLLKALALLGLRAPLAGEPEAPKDPLETLLDS